MQIVLLYANILSLVEMSAISDYIWDSKGTKPKPPYPLSPSLSPPFWKRPVHRCSISMQNFQKFQLDNHICCTDETYQNYVFNLAKNWGMIYTRKL